MMAHTPLYRAEVIAAKRNRWLGSLLVRQPWSHWVWTWLAIAMAIAAISFLMFGEYARKVRVEGRLVTPTGLIEVPAAADGILKSLRYQEGDWVDRDAVVGELIVSASDLPSRTLAIRAARAGYISAQLVVVGAHVAADQPLLALIPSDAVLEAELYLPDRLLESSVIGSDVWLRYRAFPFQHYGQYSGRIARIARSPMPRDLSSIGMQTTSEPMYRTIVTLDAQSVNDERGTSHALRPGLLLQADIVLEKRRLYEWLIEPLARLRDRFAG